MKAPAADWLAEERRKLAGENIRRALEASIGLLKWVLTSTLVLNTSAVVAFFNAEKLDAQFPLWVVWVFVIGIGCSLAGGGFLAAAAAQIARKMSNALWKGEGLDEDEMETYDPDGGLLLNCGAYISAFAIIAFLSGSFGTLMG